MFSRSPKKLQQYFVTTTGFVIAVSALLIAKYEESADVALRKL